MGLPTLCVRCRKRSCEDAKRGQLKFCEYDVAYYKTDETIIRQEAPVPLHHLATNLRHQLNPVLQLIVEQVDHVQPGVSLRRVDPTTPAGSILAATTILDMFVQMLTGVAEFHPLYGGDHLKRRISLGEVAAKYFAIYSLLKAARRPSDLTLVRSFPRDLVLPYCADIWECLVATLMDNAWKHALPASPVEIQVEQGTDASRANIIFSNRSRKLPQDIDIFAKGVKAFPGAEGFGLGLYWAQVLVYYYNQQMGRMTDELQLTHQEIPLEDGNALQRFVFVDADIAYGN